MHNFNQNAVKILEDRYLLKDGDGSIIETPEDMLERVATVVSKGDEKLKEEFLEIMRELKFLPNSPTLMNAGAKLGQLSACFVVPVEDSMHSIYKAIHDQAIIQKTGGGTGFNFSKLSEKDAFLTTSQGRASGPISFMKVFNESSRTVEQGGKRRGANMGILEADHFDIFDFIEAKNVKYCDVCNTKMGRNQFECPNCGRYIPEDTTLNYFNLSVGINDEFIQKAINLVEKGIDSDWVLRSRRDPNKIKVVKFSDLWKKIVFYAWYSGEPGLINLSEINRHNPIPTEPIDATNPCVVGDTLVQTVEGEIPIKDLVGKEIDVYCMNEKGELTISRAYNIRKTRENAELVKVVTTRGEIICTPDHKFYTKNRGWVEAKDLNPKDKIVGLNRKMKNEKYCAVGLTGTEYISEHRFIMSHYEDIEGKDVHHIDGNTLNNVKSNLEVIEHGKHSVLSNKGHIDWSIRNEKGQFVRKPVKKEKDKLTLNRPIGANLRVKEVIYLDYKEDVYDLTVENYHNFIANGVVIHNCGEQPLRPYESCNLGSINLDRLTDMEGNLDFKELERVTRLAVDFLDNVIDVNKYPLKEIEESTKQTRNIGLGVMGLARMLQKMEIPYDSPEGRAKVKEVLEIIQYFADDQSMYRARKYGNFPLYEKSVYAEQGIPMRNATRTTVAPTGSIGTLANTSGGIEPDFTHRFTRIVNQGDEEKEFKIVVENPVLVAKLKKYNLYSEELMKEIEENGGMLPENPKALVGYPASVYDLYKHLREVFKTANEISVEGHIDMLIAVQSVINNAVSKTINLPNEATVKEVEEAFIRMIKGGAKGVTVYRYGSRKFQPLVTNKKQEEKKEEKKATSKKEGYIEPPRDNLPSIKRRLYTGCGKLYLHADYDPETGDIKEVFIDKGSEGGCKIFTKATSRLLSVAIRGGIPLDILVEQLNSAGSCPSYQYARGKGKKVSPGMSCPSAIGKELVRLQKELHEKFSDYTVKEVKENESITIDPTKTSKVILKVKEEKEVEDETMKCPECGAKLLPISGCVTCPECGYSKC
ncbi:MAG: HNH endonuclease [Thermosipho sp. (in: Bacteria)]|nr:HNH endonuclease [Thermosipho sp. (in: thermotogales)]